MKSPEFALRHAAGALLRARDALQDFSKSENTTEKDLSDSSDAMQVLE